jgi:AcrR family transcriptional regulator
MSTGLTRAESQARTRGLIIEAATRLFLREGFQRTSLEQIGEEAGFTRGAVYSNFPSKTAMGIAVIDELYAREAERLEAMLGETASVEEWFDALARWADQTVGDPAWTRLEIELAASSAHEESYRAATAARYEVMRARWVALFGERFGGPAVLDPEMLGAIVVGLGLGAGVQRAFDPRLSGSDWVELLRLVLVPALGQESPDCQNF